MNKELVDAFEAAKKAGDAAAAGGGAAEEDRCVDALKRLRRMPVSTKDLVATQVGKRVRSLTKHPKPRIQAVASDLFQFWKNVVIEETSKEGTKDGNSEDRKSVKIEASSKRTEIINIDKTSKCGPSVIDIHLTSENIKVEKRASDDQALTFGKVSRSETMKVEKAVKGESRTCERDNGVQTVMVERISKEDNLTSFAKKPSIPSGPPRLTSMIKCNDPLRDKLRELLAESFAKVSAEASVDSRDEVRNRVDEINVSDPIRVAVMVESVMFEKLGRSNGTHKVKYRSIMFNLKDAKNTDLRRRVLLGHVKPEKLINMTAEEMASDDRKLENRQIQEKALFECERAGAPKATTDQFKCGRCGQRKCTYYQLQTRSADEPMTTFVTCVNCNNHWKFC